MNKNAFKYLLCLGHPIPFWILLFGSSLDDKSSFLISEPSTNVFRINLVVYFILAALIYVAWLLFQYFFVAKWYNVSWPQFLVKKFTSTYLILCGLGFINLIFWFIGMEGNAFGFLFAIPLAVLTVVLSYYELKMFWKGNFQT